MPNGDRLVIDVRASQGSSQFAVLIVGLPACTKYRRTWKSRTYEMFYWFLVLEIMLIQKLHDATLASLSNFFYSRFKITFSV